MRTQQEIVERIREVSKDDFLGFETNDLYSYLTFDNAREFLVPDATGADWKTCPSDHESIKAEMVAYLPFAYEKCTGHRGLSAGRSVAHYRQWFWMLGDDAAVEFLSDDGNYEPYGAPMLKYAAERIGATMPTDGGCVFDAMATNGSCEPGCVMGCLG